MTAVKLNHNQTSAWNSFLRMHEVIVLPGGWGDSLLKVKGMLVVSLRVVNFQFLVSLKMFQANNNIFSQNGFV